MPPSVDYQQAPQDNQEMTDRGMKRSLAPGTLPKQPKKPRLIKLDPRSSPLQYLNTIRPGLNFKIERTGGPAHEPRFSVSVVVDGRTYSGLGKSKQHAKQFAAVEALKLILNDSSLQYIEDAPRGPGGIVMPEPAPPEKPVAPAPPPAQTAPDTQNPAPSTQAVPSAISIAGKTPVQILNEMDTSAVYECIAEDPVNLPRRFTMTVTVKGVTYRAFGANKKQAKHACARSALIAMGTPIADSESLAEDALADIQGTIPRHQANQNLSDRIGTKMLDKFEEVMRNRPDKKPWKVLAGTGSRFQNGYGNGGGGGGGGGPSARGMLANQRSGTNQYQATSYYKITSYYQQLSPQRQPTHQQPQHQHAPFRPVVKRNSGPYGGNFVLAASSFNGPQSRTNWPNSNNSSSSSNTPGNYVVNSNVTKYNSIPLQDRNSVSAQTRYQTSGDSRNAGYYAYEHYRARRSAIQGADYSPQSQIASAKSGATLRGGHGSGGGSNKAMTFASLTSPSSQGQWVPNWAETSDTTNWQYHNAYYGNGEATSAHDMAPTANYTAGWNYGGYGGQDASTYSNYGSAMDSPQMVLAGTPQGYTQGDGRNINEYSAWGARY